MYIYIYVYVRERSCVHVCVQACDIHMRASGALELEVQMIVNCLMWLLETKLGSPGRGVCALNN